MREVESWSHRLAPLAANGEVIGPENVLAALRTGICPPPQASAIVGEKFLIDASLTHQERMNECERLSIIKELPVEKYYVTDIEYTACYLKGDKDTRLVILDTGSKSFSIYYRLWRKEYKEEDVINMLSKSSRARIWLTSRDDTEIKGIQATYFRIDPSKGYEWDKTNRNSLLWISAGLILLGLLVIVTARFSRIQTPRQ